MNPAINTPKQTVIIINKLRNSSIQSIQQIQTLISTNPIQTEIHFGNELKIEWIDEISLIAEMDGLDDCLFI